MLRGLCTAILALSVAFAAIGARGSDLVLCVGPGGHFAVEREHGSGECRESLDPGHDDHNHQHGDGDEDSPEPPSAVTIADAPDRPGCTDLDPCGIDADAAARAGVSTDLAVLPVIPVAVVLPTPSASADIALRVYTDAGPPPQGAPDAVEHIVLLN